MGNNTISKFSGEYVFLSNMFAGTVIYEGLQYPCVEAAYQAAKCQLETERVPFQYMDGREAKKQGRRVKLRGDWDSVRLQVMYDCVKDKFTRNGKLKEKLLATGDAVLVEGNYWHDTFWGVCDGVGENNLGKILMKVRTELSETA